MGIGKSAVSRELMQLLPRCAFLDGDWCWTMLPFTVTDETKGMVLDNITHTLGNFIRCSAFDNIVFCWVMHQQQIIDDILFRLPLDGVKVICVSLIASPDALTERIRQDIAAACVMKVSSHVLRPVCSYMIIYSPSSATRLLCPLPESQNKSAKLGK